MTDKYQAGIDTPLLWGMDIVVVWRPTRKILAYRERHALLPYADEADLQSHAEASGLHSTVHGSSDNVSSRSALHRLRSPPI